MSRSAAETLRGGTCVGAAPASLRSAHSVSPDTDNPKLDAHLDLVCALLWGGDPIVLRHVLDDDLDPPADRIIATIRHMHAHSLTVTPALVGDQLMRHPSGPLLAVLATLREATTRKVCPEATRALAAAVVAQSLRRRTESAGHALQSAAFTEAESGLVPMIAGMATSVADCGHRLAMLRGEQHE